jgi:glycosyltransferase involved in cell wall biosynthesis
MKVAMLGPIAWRTPPVHYGPWELITSLLTEGLVARGVEVTLFASLDSITAAALDGVSPSGYEENPAIDGRVWEALHVSHALTRSGEFDLVHNHLDWLPLAFSQHCAVPMVTTVHGFSGPNILPAYQRASSHFVSISDADRSPDLSYIATVYHGIDLSALPDPTVGIPARPEGRTPHTTPVAPSVGIPARPEGRTPHTTPIPPSVGIPAHPDGRTPHTTRVPTSVGNHARPEGRTPHTAPVAPSVGSHARQEGRTPHTTPVAPSVGIPARPEGRAPHATHVGPTRGEPRPPDGPQSPPGDSSGLICFGRIHPDKGTDTAIEIARRAGRRLIICGIIQDRAFFESAVAPHIDGDRVTYLGSVGPDQRGKILSSGAALLHPIRFAEPFGLSVVESMACGTPVIAYRKGSMPEVVDPGVTGLLTENVDEAVAAVAAVGGIDRIACARRARERFSAERMVDDYLAIYRKIVAE